MTTCNNDEVRNEQGVTGGVFFDGVPADLEPKSDAVTLSRLSDRC